MKFKNNIIAFVFIGLLGTLGHFFYEWSGEYRLVGLFFPVSESTWEHLKLLFFPTLIYSIFEYFCLKEKPRNYLQAVTVSVFCGMLSIATLFYTTSGILGYSVDFINIAIYFISIIIMLCKKQKIIKNEKLSSSAAFWGSVIILIITAILFVICSYNPPSLGIFTPPAM